MGKLEKMKFAKILLIISAIAFVASRTVTKEEEYMSETKALRIETGYKELMEIDDKTLREYKTKNWKVTLEMNDAKAEGEVANTIFYAKLETQIFRSGIPFNFKTAPAAGMGKNLIKYSDNTYYIPFNTVVGQAYAGEHSSSGNTMIQMTVQNKSGYGALNVVFTEAKYDDHSETYLGNMASDWMNARNVRNNFVRTQFKNVKTAALEAKTNIQKIKEIKDSDAERKKNWKLKSQKKKRSTNSLTNEVTEANNKFIKASGELATVETKLANEKSKRSKLVIERNNLEANIKLLKGDVKPEEVLNKLKKKMEDSLKEADYWLKGSVYHRVVSEGEKSELMKIILDDAKFDERVAGYFSPQ